MFDSPFDKEPDFTNTIGTKWWLDKSLTKYAHEKDLNDVALTEVSIWYTQRKDGYKTRLMTIDNDIVYEATALDAMASKIDFIKLAKHHEE